MHMFYKNGMSRATYVWNKSCLSDLCTLPTLAFSYTKKVVTSFPFRGRDTSHTHKDRHTLVTA